MESQQNRLFHGIRSELTRSHIPGAAGAPWRQVRLRVLAVLLLALLPAVGLSAVAVWSAMRSYRDAAEADLLDQARAVALVVDAKLATYRMVAGMLAASPELNPGSDPARVYELIRRAADATGARIVLIGPGPDFPALMNSALPLGQMPSSDRATILGAASAERARTEVFRTGQPRVLDLFSGRVTERFFAAIMVPVIRDGRVIAAISMSFEPQDLEPLLHAEACPADMFVKVVDANGHLVARAPDPGAMTGRPTPDWYGPAIAGRESGLMSGTDMEGHDSRYAFTRLREAPGWTVAAARPVAAIAAAALRPIHGFVLAALATATGMVLVVGLLWIGRREAHQEASALRAGRERTQHLHSGVPIIIFQVRFSEARSFDLRSFDSEYLGGDIEQVTGWPRDSLRTTDDWDARIVGPPIPRRAFYQTAVATGEATHEFSLRRPDGQTARMLVHVRLLERHADGSSDVVGYIRDVTAEREATARAMTASRLASLGEMATALAHELRQPLAVMSFAAENAAGDLEAQDLNAARVRLERIVDQSLRAGAVIDHLQQFGRGDPPDAPLEAIDLRAAVTSALTLVGGALRHAGIEVVIAIDTPSPLVRAQQVSLEQVLVNLLLNARDALATSLPDHAKWIRLTAARDADTVRLEVADSGGGIPAEVIERVFEPFVTTKPVGKGTGLGLSLSHGTMRSFGGSITVRNGPDGAIFTLTFQAGKQGQGSPLAGFGAEPQPYFLPVSWRMRAS